MRARPKTALFATALLAGLAGGMSAAPAVAQAPPVSPADFVSAAGASNRYEILAADVALATSRNAEIRTFAQQMIRDHTAMDTALRDAATRAGLKPPSDAVGADLAPLLAALQSERGAEFDRAYARQQVIVHSSALATERRYARQTASGELGRLAASDVPMIERHLQAAAGLRSAAS